MVKLLKKGDRVYIELPDTLKDKKIKAIKLGPEIFVVTSEDAIKELIRRQMNYIIGKRVRERLVRNPEKKKESEKKPTEKGHATKFSGRYMILSSDDAARAFSRAYKRAFEARELLGVKGFDGKYYVVSASAYYDVVQKLPEALKDGATIDELAARMGEDKNFIKAVLEVAKEDGLVYEEKDGRYRYVG